MAQPTERERLVARGRLTPGVDGGMGPALDHAFPIDEQSCFERVLRAIDEAERQVWRDCDEVAKARD